MNWDSVSRGVHGPLAKAYGIRGCRYYVGSGRWRAYERLKKLGDFLIQRLCSSNGYHAGLWNTPLQHHTRDLQLRFLEK